VPLFALALATAVAQYPFLTLSYFCLILVHVDGAYDENKTVRVLRSHDAAFLEPSLVNTA